MNPVNSAHLKLSTAVAFCLFVCLAFSALPAYGEEKPGEITIPTVFRDAYKKEKPLAIEITNQKLTGVSIMIGKN